MRKKGYKPEQIISKLRQADVLVSQGKTVDEKKAFQYILQSIDTVNSLKSYYSATLGNARCLTKS